jgi:hypothetical protein
VWQNKQHKTVRSHTAYSPRPGCSASFDPNPQDTVISHQLDGFTFLANTRTAVCGSALLAAALRLCISLGWEVHQLYAAAQDQTALHEGEELPLLL